MASFLRNPICSQMDQMLLKCEEVEAVLALLVTHRGVFFVHNLGTAIQAGQIDRSCGQIEVLASMEANHLELNRLQRDPRQRSWLTK